MGETSVLVSRRVALDGVQLPGDEGLIVALAPPATRFILRAQPSAVATFGPATPARMRATTAKGRATLWLGPDEFLLIAPGEDAGVIGSHTERLLAAEPHSLVDVSHRQIGLLLEGRQVARILSAGCPLDLRLSSFPVGMATRTIFHKVELVLWRQAEQRFSVEVWRSYAPYLVAHLGEALTDATVV